MRIASDHPDFDKTLVFLNGKWIRSCQAADDEEGWVEIIDIASMAPIKVHTKGHGYTPDHLPENEWEQFKTKKLYGTVTFKKA